ncbi:hypothetical protein NADFUDRAFT_48508 [Nadsonia fulvescens var. elongata DSM 6958]|uniref:Uncharacterized protein n=1 Tax=Nadsonia fulvescens var. elongata DSM 6958 TaxID=857566 RepID=A0A1E3PRG1_9ASCO|nr:hypothetical protein NADFUDRAFT_48508 [Nadsonia fulvescens var. elongata DSM 6958]
MMICFDDTAVSIKISVRSQLIKDLSEEFMKVDNGVLSDIEQKLPEIINKAFTSMGEFQNSNLIESVLLKYLRDFFMCNFNQQINLKQTSIESLLLVKFSLNYSDLSNSA